MNQFYTYLYFRKNGTPYYVGKGRGDRAFRNTPGHHPPKARARIFLQYWASEQEAFEMEKWYIKLFGRKDNGSGILRNLTDGGEGQAGSIRSQEICRRMSAAHKGKPLTESHRMKIGAGNKGRVFTPDTRAKIGAARRGKPGHKQTSETRRRISAAHKGRALTEEHRANLSAAKKSNPLALEQCRRLGLAYGGRVPTQETRQKMSRAAQGKQVSAEARAKMSQAQRGRRHSAESKMRMAWSNVLHPRGPLIRKDLPVERIGQLYCDGQSLNSIAAIFNVSRNTVASRVKEYGIALRPPRRPRSKNKEQIMSNARHNSEQDKLFVQTANQINPGAARPEDFKIEERDGGQRRAALLAEADSDGKSKREPIPERNEVPSRRISEK